MTRRIDEHDAPRYITRRATMSGIAIVSIVGATPLPVVSAGYRNCPGCVCITNGWCVKHKTCALEYEPPLRG